MFNCATLQKTPKVRLVAPFVSALLLSIMLGVGFIPLLARHLKGARRIYTMAQQICTILHSILFGLTQFMVNSTTFMEKYSSDGVFYSAIVESILGLLRSFLYYFFYFLSLMQSMDIYVMICWSFQHKKFSCTTTGLKMVALGAGICLFLSSDELALTIRVALTSSTFLKNQVRSEIDLDLKSWLKFYLIASIFFLVKLCLIKISFAIAIARIAQLVRHQLISSMAMPANVDRRRRYNALLVFVCVPLLMNVIFIVYDATIILDFITYYGQEFKCNNEEIFFKDAVTVRAFVFTLNSFIQSISYLVLFPKFRKSFWCKTE